MQNVIYCPRCKKYVPYKKVEEVRERMTEEISYYYMEEASKCDLCGFITYTNKNLRNNLYKAADVFNDIMEMRKNM